MQHDNSARWEAASPYAGLTLSLDAWAARDVPPRRLLLGDIFSATTRAMLVADTGIGKTHLGFAFAFAMAAGEPFCHWEGHEPAKVLIVDGEMSIGLMKERLADAERRLGIRPPDLHCVCREEAEQMPALDTPEGQAWMDGLVQHLGGIDFLILDNIMSLTSGDMLDPEGWKPVTTWMRALTARQIGCLWIHHTGHDGSRSFGTKTREWQLDLVMVGEKVDDLAADIALKVTFKKARQRTPATREDYETTTLRLTKDIWTSDNAGQRQTGRVSPAGLKFKDALANALSLPAAEHFNGQRAVTFDVWRNECERMGLIDGQDKPHSARALLSKYRRELVAANVVVCENDLVWMVS